MRAVARPLLLAIALTIAAGACNDTCERVWTRIEKCGARFSDAKNSLAPIKATLGRRCRRNAAAFERCLALRDCKRFERCVGLAFRPKTP